MNDYYYYHFLHIVRRHRKSQPFLVYRTEKHNFSFSEVARRPIPVPTTKIAQFVRCYSLFIWFSHSIESLNRSKAAARWTSIILGLPSIGVTFSSLATRCAGPCFVHSAYYYCLARGVNHETSVLHVAANARSKWISAVRLELDNNFHIVVQMSFPTSVRNSPMKFMIMCI